MIPESNLRSQVAGARRAGGQICGSRHAALGQAVLDKHLSWQSGQGPRGQRVLDRLPRSSGGRWVSLNAFYS